MSKVMSLSDIHTSEVLVNKGNKRTEGSGSSVSEKESCSPISITGCNSTCESASKPRQQRARAIKSIFSNYAIHPDYFAATLRAKTYFLPDEKGRLQEIKESDFHNLVEKLQDEQSLQIGDNILLIRENWNGKADKPKGTEFYSRMYEVYLGEHGEPFAQLLTLPNDRRGALLPYDYCEIKINNWEFYRENSDGAGWASKLVYLLSELNLEINSVVRMDIAIDGEHLLDVYRRRMDKRDIELKGRRKNEEWCNGWGEDGKPAIVGTTAPAQELGTNTTILNGGEMTGFYVGSGAKSLCGYQKWQRIEADDKFYIAECCKLNGVGEKFERLELRVKSEHVRTIPGFEQHKETIKAWNGIKNKYVRKEYRHPLDVAALLKLQEPGFLASVMKSQFENWFEFIPVKGDSNKSRRPTIQFIDWERLEASELKRLSVVRKPSDVWLAERTGKGLITFAENPALVERVRREIPALFDAKKIDWKNSDALRAQVDRLLRDELTETFPYKLPPGAFDKAIEELTPIYLRHILSCMDGKETRELMRSVGFGIADFHHRRDWLEKKDAEIDREPKTVVKVKLKD